VTASKIDANLDEALTFADPIGGIGNICGLPAISVACGYWPATACRWASSSLAARSA